MFLFHNKQADNKISLGIHHRSDLFCTNLERNVNKAKKIIIMRNMQQYLHCMIHVYGIEQPQLCISHCHIYYSKPQYTELLQANKTRKITRVNFHGSTPVLGVHYIP
jgi:hypothetical protein